MGHPNIQSVIDDVCKPSKMKRYIGLRNIVTSKSDWKYLILYEIDGHDESNLVRTISFFNKIETSFIVYRTINGYHFVGLTPINSQQWGHWFGNLQNFMPEYFSGQTLRISLKEGETQELEHFSFRYPYLYKLSRIYVNRFNIPEVEMPIYGDMPDYKCVFEKYWTGKIR